MVAQIKVRVNSASSSHDKWGSHYTKGKAPSQEALKCEQHFKEMTQGLKSPEWLGYSPDYFWRKLERTEKVQFKENYQYIIGAAQEGMKNSHPGIELKKCNLLKLLDFVLGVDHSLIWNGKTIGFDVTKNPYAVDVKLQKTHKAYLGTKLELLKEFYDGYIIILWSVENYKVSDKDRIKRQFLKGLANWRPKEFTHVIELK